MLPQIDSQEEFDAAVSEQCEREDYVSILEVGRLMLAGLQGGFIRHRPTFSGVDVALPGFDVTEASVASCKMNELLIGLNKQAGATADEVWLAIAELVGQYDAEQARFEQKAN